MEMMRASSRGQRALAGIFLAVVLGFMGSIVCSYIASKFEEKPASKEISIDWQSLYPFPPEAQSPITARPPLVEKVIDFLHEWSKIYSADRLFGYMTFVETALRYEGLIRWNFTTYNEYNGVTVLSDGYLGELIAKHDVSEAAQSVIEFARFCEERGIDFLYVNVPHKICKIEDELISGTLDFSNQNADELLRQIAAAGVKYLDLRQTLHEDNMSHHAAFYKTDGHWRGETGLWASRRILQFLRDEYGYPVDPSVLDDGKFTAVNYPKRFFGHQGGKVTLARAKPEDAALLYPIYPTHVRFEVPTLSLDIDGDFSDTYDMSWTQKKGFYGTDIYGAYSYGHKAVTRMENLLNGAEKRICLIRDSFSDAVIPFLGLGIKHVDALSTVAFDGSIRNYIQTTKPDAVIVLYTLGQLKNTINWETHKSHFDFR